MLLDDVVCRPCLANCVPEEPLRLRDTFDKFFFTDVFDPMRGKVTLELFRRMSWVDGLVEGVWIFTFACCLATPFSSAPCAVVGLVNLLRFLPYDGFRACAILPWPAACALWDLYVEPRWVGEGNPPEGDARESNCAEVASAMDGRLTGKGEP